MPYEGSRKTGGETADASHEELHYKHDVGEVFDWEGNNAEDGRLSTNRGCGRVEVGQCVEKWVEEEGGFDRHAGELWSVSASQLE